MLAPIALAASAATLIQAVTSFSLSQVLGVAAQRAITEMRKRVQAQVERLPISYFDSTQTGKLISRVMNDAEGIRNLVGTGIVQLVGSCITAVGFLGVLLYLNWRLTALTIVVLAAFGGSLAYAFKNFAHVRERGRFTAGSRAAWANRSAASASSKAYTAEALGTGLRARRAQTFPQHREIDQCQGFGHYGILFPVIIGAVGRDDSGRRSSVLTGQMTLGDLFMYVFFTGLMAMPVIEIAAIGTQITEAFADSTASAKF